MAAESAKLFKIKHSSGRVLGPLELDRVAKLIEKGEIVGGETARAHPDGDWTEIEKIAELNELLQRKLRGELVTGNTTSILARPKPGEDNLYGTTEIISQEEVKTGITKRIKEIKDPKTRSVPGLPSDVTLEKKASVPSSASAGLDEGDPTVFAPAEDRTVHAEPGTSERRRIATEETVMLGVPKPSRKLDPKRLRRLAVIGFLVLIVFEVLDMFDSPGIDTRLPPVRAEFPTFVNEKVDPKKSAELFAAAMVDYLQDHELAYRSAADTLRQAASLDPSNPKALAMLASTYLNLSESAIKDDQYVQTISKLLELAKGRGVQLIETVIAETEFYLLGGNVDAAEKAVKNHLQGEAVTPETLFLLAEVYFQKGEKNEAAEILAKIPDDRAFGPKVFFLRGKIAEAYEFWEDAIKAYDKALALPTKIKHPRSLLGVIRVREHQGQIRNAGSELKLLFKNFTALGERERAEALGLRASWYKAEGKLEKAVADAKQAVVLEPWNHDQILRYYQLRAEAGESIESLKPQARMFFFLGEGEKAAKEFHLEEAIRYFVQAREARPGDTLPLKRLGQAFLEQGDLINARANFEKALATATEDAEVLALLARTLVESYEWDEAVRVMEKLRGLKTASDPKTQTTIFRISGDMLMKEKQYGRAMEEYKRAFSAGSSDGELYVKYGQALLELKQATNARLFFTLAQRLDPLSVPATLGLARVKAETESSGSAATFLKAEMLRFGSPRAELLTSLAELEVERGETKTAMDYLRQAKTANPDYARAFWVEGRAYEAMAVSDKKQIQKALDAYESYSKRVGSDPAGFLSRHEIFIKLGDFGRATQELDKIYGQIPKFPNLSFYRGKMLAAMANTDEAFLELEKELKAHPNNVPALLFYGTELIKAGQHGRALELFVRAMNAAPQMGEPKHLAAYANFLLKNYEGAVALYQAALQFDAGNPLIYKRLGTAYESLGKKAEAAESYRKYIQMAPDAPDREQYEAYE